jgi:hypothetical protein
MPLRLRLGVLRRRDWGKGMESMGFLGRVCCEFTTMLQVDMGNHSKTGWGTGI